MEVDTSGHNSSRDDDVRIVVSSMWHPWLHPGWKILLTMIGYGCHYYVHVTWDNHKWTLVCWMWWRHWLWHCVCINRCSSRVNAYIVEHVISQVIWYMMHFTHLARKFVHREQCIFFVITELKKCIVSDPWILSRVKKVIHDHLGLTSESILCWNNVSFSY